VVAWWPGGNRFHALGLHSLAGVLLTAALLLPELPAFFRRLRPGAFQGIGDFFSSPPPSPADGVE
jgi:hypothetical protein